MSLHGLRAANLPLIAAVATLVAVVTGQVTGATAVAPTSGSSLPARTAGAQATFGTLVAPVRINVVGPEYNDPSSNTWLADATFPDGLGYGYFELIGSARSQASQSPLGIAGTDAGFDVVEPGLESRLGSA